MSRRVRLAMAWLVVFTTTAITAQGGVTTTFYGDDDGFGIGATSGSLNPDVDNSGPGEAPFTDIRLIGGAFAFPPFAPTSFFDVFTLPFGETIVGATLTMRTGAWVSGPNPVSGPNQMYLDGLQVPSSFFNLFVNPTDLIEMRSIALDSSFYPLLADGAVSLNGTRLSENAGSFSFQVDFLRLDVETVLPEPPVVPEPSTLALGCMGIAGLAYRISRRKRLSSHLA